jgi:hypothetical protein
MSNINGVNNKRNGENNEETGSSFVIMKDNMVTYNNNGVMTA